MMHVFETYKQCNHRSQPSMCINPNRLDNDIYITAPPPRHPNGNKNKCQHVRGAIFKKQRPGKQVSHHLRIYHPVYMLID